MSELKTWKTRLKISDDKFKPVESGIKKRRNYYNGNQWPGMRGEKESQVDRAYRDKTVDNMVFANITSIMPSVNFNNPKIFIDARKPPYRKGDLLFDTNAAASIAEVLTNYRIQELQVKREVDKCLLDALIGPWGIVELGYTSKTEKFKGNTKLEINELIKSANPFALRVSPLDFRVDPEAKDSHLNDAGWVSRSWVKTLEEVKKNPKYSNTANLKPNAVVKTEDNSVVVSPSDAIDKINDSDMARVVGRDIWDLRNGRLITIVDTHDKFLRNDKAWPLEFDGYPFKTLYFHEDPDELYPLSEVDIYLPAQDELNRLRSLQLSHVKRVSQRKYVAKDGAWPNETELDKIEYGGDGVIAMTNGDVSSAIAPLKDAPISQDQYITINQLKQAISESSSVAQFERGIAQKFDTATEPALIAQGVSIKRAERLQKVENFYIDISKTLLKIDQQTLEPSKIPLNERQFAMAREATPTKLEKITGQNESLILLPWLNVTKDDIDGEFDFSMDMGSTEPINQEKRKQDTVTVSELLANSPYVNREEEARRILDAFNVKDQESLLIPAEQVAQNQQAAAEQALNAEIQKDLPKREVDLEKTRIKSETTLQAALIKGMGEKQKSEDLKDIARMQRSE